MLDLQAAGLLQAHPDLKAIIAPTTVGIREAAKYISGSEYKGEVAVTGLGLPSEMVSYTLNDCAPQFALWSFVDLGYLTYYVSYLLATGQIEAVDGQTFTAGRMGEYTIEKDRLTLIDKRGPLACTGEDCFSSRSRICRRKAHLFEAAWADSLSVFINLKIFRRQAGYWLSRAVDCLDPDIHSGNRHLIVL